MPYCPKMGLASFRTSDPGILAVPPTPRRIGFVSHLPVAFAPYTSRLASFRTSGIRKGLAGNRAGVRQASGGLASFRILIALALHASRLASFRTCGPGILAVPPTPADWLRFAFSVCRRPAHLPIGFVPHQSPPCAPNHAPSRADTSMFPTRTQAFKLYCGYRGMA